MIFNNPFKQILIIFLGGGVGSVCRFLISYLVQTITQNLFFPFGILVVNILGCFGIGLIVGIFFEHYTFGTLWRAGIIIGFFGGFTTLSSVSLDTLTLLQSAEYVSGFANILLNLVGCLLATFLGLSLARLVL